MFCFLISDFSASRVCSVLLYSAWPLCFMVSVHYCSPPLQVARDALGFCPTFLAITMQDQGIWNVPSRIKLYYLVRIKVNLCPLDRLKCVTEMNQGMEYNDYTEGKSGIGNLLLGCHIWLSTLVWWSRHHSIPLQILTVQDSVKIGKKCTTLFWEENKHGCTEHLTLQLLSEYFYEGGWHVMLKVLICVNI